MASGAGRRRHAREPRQHLGAHPSDEVHAGGVGEPLGAPAVHGEVCAEDGLQLRLETVTERADRVHPDPPASDLAGRAERHVEEHVLGAGPAPRLVPGTVHEGLEPRTAPDVEGADSLGRVELVPRDREEVHTEVVNPRRDLPGALRGVGVHEHAGRAGDGSDLLDGLDRPDLVVGVHDADEDGARGDGAADGLGIDSSLAVHADDRDLRAQPLKELQRLQDGRMLDGAGDEVVAAITVGEEDSLQRMVVRLGAAAREDDLVRCGAEQLGDLTTRPLHRRLRRRARPVAVRRIAEMVGEERPHGLRGLGSERRAGVEVEVGLRVLHHLAPS